jgi:hypothetical protein
MTSFRLGLLVGGVVALGLFLVYAVLDPQWQACQVAKTADPSVVCARHAELALVLTQILAALLTLFGTLALAGGQDETGSFREERIRFSIAISVLVLYLVFFGMAVFWDTGTNRAMVETLTNLMMVVIPFYFGASAVAQASSKKSRTDS